MATLRSVADALGVEYQSLILRERLQSEPPPGRKKSMAIIFKKPAEEFDAERDLPPIIDTLRSMTLSYFSAHPDRRGPYLSITVEMNEEEMEDLIGGTIGWVDVFDDIGDPAYRIVDVELGPDEFLLGRGWN